jgi:hypothetical protein
MIHFVTSFDGNRYDGRPLKRIGIVLDDVHMQRCLVRMPNGKYRQKRSRMTTLAMIWTRHHAVSYNSLTNNLCLYRVWGAKIDGQQQSKSHVVSS